VRNYHSSERGSSVKPIQKRKAVKLNQKANWPITIENRITFSTVIGQFDYCLRLTALHFLYVPWALRAACA